MMPVFSCHDADYIVPRYKDTIKAHQTVHVRRGEGRCVCVEGGEEEQKGIGGE